MISSLMGVRTSATQSQMEISSQKKEIADGLVLQAILNFCRTFFLISLFVRFVYQSIGFVLFCSVNLLSLGSLEVSSITLLLHDAKEGSLPYLRSFCHHWLSCTQIILSKIRSIDDRSIHRYHTISLFSVFMSQQLLRMAEL